jgi:DNA-binding PadR family transcriptional regulator
MGARGGGHRGSTVASEAPTRAATGTLPLAAWLVLALVVEKPSHGYELYQRYERRFAGLLPKSRSSIYEILPRLRADGMIEPIVIEPDCPAGRQYESRNSYRATRIGAQAFRGWVAEWMVDDSGRQQVLARIASVYFLGVDLLLGVIDHYERECMREMKALPVSDLEDEHCGVAELVESLVVDQRRREVRARIDWATHARRVLQTHASRLAAERAEQS